MTGPEIWLIAAAARNGVIGREGRLPWRLKADLARFKALTMGAPVVMGRKTWESLGRALPGRQNLVITRHPDYAASGATVVASFGAALMAAGDVPRVWVIGGGEIYRLALPHATGVQLTEVACEVEGDTAFPSLRFEDFAVVAESHHPQDADNEHAMRFVEYRRRIHPAR